MLDASIVQQGVAARYGASRRSIVALWPRWRRAGLASLFLVVLLTLLAVVLVDTESGRQEASPSIGAIRLALVLPPLALFGLSFAIAHLLPAVILAGGSIATASLAGWITYAGVSDLAGRPLGGDDVELLFTFGVSTGVFILVVGGSIEGLRTRAKAERLNDRDFLTGLLSREGFQRRYDLLAPNRPSTLAMIDLNLLKSINDHEGHAAGDRYLTSIAHVLADHLPEDALTSRWGGDEFLILVPGRAKEDVEGLLDALESRLPPAPSAIPVWAVGLADLETGQPLDAPFADADARMYEQKRQQYSRVDGAGDWVLRR